jgi:hypothetical protein
MQWLLHPVQNALVHCHSTRLLVTWLNTVSVSGVLQMQTFVNKGELLPDEIVSKVHHTPYSVSFLMNLQCFIGATRS